MDGNSPVEVKKNGVNRTIMMLIVIAALLVALNVYLLTDINTTPARVTIYGAPPELKAAEDRIVTVEGKPLFVYDTAVNFNRTWSKDPKLGATPVTYFDFDGTVNIKITVPGQKLEKVVVRPLALGIEPKIKGDTISFKLEHPAQLTIEINDDVQRALHLFANAMEENTPKQDDPNVIYFGPGIHEVGRIPVQSNQTIYIAGGAVVYGCVKAENLENLKIQGRGIINGSIYDRWVDTMVPIDFRNCKNVSVEGITLLDPSAWTLNIFSSENVKVNDVKIISARSNSDGITIQSSKEVAVTNCFVRSWDDSLVVKGYDGDARGITFDNCILWTDLAQSCEIGYETRANTIEDITFKNITVLHNFHKPVLSIHNSDNALIQNVHYENIVVEDAKMGMGDAAGYNYLIDLNIGTSQWSQARTRGNIKDITFENINVLGGEFQPSRIMGYDDTHKIENITIKNFKMLGQDIKDIETGKFKVNNYAENIVFE